MKGLLISISALLVLIIGMMLWLWVGKGTGDPGGDAVLPSGNQPFAASDDGRDGAKISIATASGTVAISDVRKRSDTNVRDEDTYEVSGFAANDYTPAFNIIFSESSASLAVALNEEPLGATRRAAESRLLQVLGISTSELCQLRVYVGTTFDVNPEFAGKNLGLSFCPGSVQLAE